MSGHMNTSQLPRRASRSSGSQLSFRSTRVEKPKSHQNSPRTVERRKTTTESKLYATLDDHYRMMFGLEPEDSEEDRTHQGRPLSWHPSSTHFKNNQSTSYFESQPDWSRQYTVSPRHSAHGSDFYSLSTRNSSYEPTMNQSTTPGGHGGHRGSDESDYSWQSNAQHTPSYVHSAVNTPMSEPLPWYLQQWAQKNQAQQPQNGSSDFLPIQHPTAQDEEMEDDDGEKLVALGLYDMPESSMSWTGFEEPTGKGLKLEETWQPPEEDEDEEEEDDADDASSADSVEEPSPPLPAVDAKSQQLQLPVQVKAQTPGSMEGQSFFFDDDESVNKEWWYQQLKQPTVAMRPNDLGYGWL